MNPLTVLFCMYIQRSDEISFIARKAIPPKIIEEMYSKPHKALVYTHQWLAINSLHSIIYNRHPAATVHYRSKQISAPRKIKYKFIRTAKLPNRQNNPI